MSRISGRAKAVLLVLVALSLGACFRIQIIRRVEDPRPYFEDARRAIQEIEREDPDRRIRPHGLFILAYSAENGELIRGRLPLWMIRAALRVGLEAAEHQGELEEWRDRYDFDGRILRELDRLGCGLLIEIDDGADQVLIWLE